MSRAAAAVVAGAEAPVAWDGDLGIWEIVDRDLIPSVLQNPAFEVIDFKTAYRSLMSRFGIDFGSTMSILDYVPLGLAGDQHHNVRRLSTIHIKHRKHAGMAAFEVAFRHAIADSREGSSLDILKAVISPSVAAMMTEVSGTTSDLFDPPTISQIFDAHLSLNRRKRIEAKLAQMLERARQIMSEEEARLSVALFMVGADSIHATLGVSLRHEIEANKGRRLNDFVWSSAPTITGVPYVDRVAREDAELAGVRINTGERLRIRLDEYDGHPDASHFGVGSHTCIGKALSLSAWTVAISILSELPYTATITAASQRRSDLLFNALETLEVKFT